MFRLIFLTFHNEPQRPDLIDDIHESPWEMTTPLVILSGLSFFIVFTLPHFNPFSDHGWFMDIIRAQDSLVAGALSAHEIAEGIHHSHLLAMILSLLVAGTGIYLAWQMYIKKGMRIAQMIIQKVEYPRLEEVESLDITKRDDSGFGSTGLH